MRHQSRRVAAHKLVAAQNAGIEIVFLDYVNIKRASAAPKIFTKKLDFL